ncbi:MAG: hypothetical protein USCGTAYLOR_01889 [Chromatiales bacterium USCg_Taylor]|nr:MAG: hypothetical protein USCGTAYLOR_01889 [Chromatiales bacterium USCg_Taylor]
MITKILAAYDGSEPAGHAYRFALDLAKHYGAELLVLAVARPPEPPEDVETEAILENAEAHYKELFDTLKGEAANQGLKPRFEEIGSISSWWVTAVRASSNGSWWARYLNRS